MDQSGIAYSSIQTMNQSITLFNPNYEPFDKIVHYWYWSLIAIATSFCIDSVCEAGWSTRSHDIGTISTLTQVLTVMQLSVLYLLNIQLFLPFNKMWNSFYVDLLPKRSARGASCSVFGSGQYLTGCWPRSYSRGVERSRTNSLRRPVSHVCLQGSIMRHCCTHRLHRVAANVTFRYDNVRSKHTNFCNKNLFVESTLSAKDRVGSQQDFARSRLCTGYSEHRRGWPLNPKKCCRKHLCLQGVSYVVRRT